MSKVAMRAMLLSFVVAGAGVRPAKANVTGIGIDCQLPICVGTTVTYTATEAPGTPPASSYKWEYQCMSPSCGSNGGGWVTAAGTGQSIAFIENKVGPAWIKVTGTYMNWATMPPTTYTIPITRSYSVAAPTSDGPAGQAPGGNEGEAPINQTVTLTFPLTCAPGLASLNLQEQITRQVNGVWTSSAWTDGNQDLYIQGATIYDVKLTSLPLAQWNAVPAGPIDAFYQQMRITPVDCCGNPGATIYFTKRFFARYKLANGNWQIKYLGDSPPL